MYAPVRGFGKIWSENSGLRQSLGWATEPETSVTGAWQPYGQGNMLWISTKTIFVMYDDGNWESFPDTFVAPTPANNHP